MAKFVDEGQNAPAYSKFLPKLSCEHVPQRHFVEECMRSSSFVLFQNVNRIHERVCCDILLHYLTVDTGRFVYISDCDRWKNYLILWKTSDYLFIMYIEM